MSEPRFAVGIDLGTTHCAMARTDCRRPDAPTEPIAVPQLVAPRTVEERPLLPSFLYLPPEGEGAQPLPWARDREFAVGHHARARAAEAPGRVVSSAKSWLCHPSLDRRAGVLPLSAADDVEKISAVEASWRYLEHLTEAFDRRFANDPDCGPLAEQEVIVTVPASFDAAARELTVEAASAAGFELLTLLEEPQAALYAWLEAQGEAWRSRLRPGDLLLVVDIGGGTSDFSAISVVDRDGSLELERVAVGDHILLGGDNMDLALAHRVRATLAAKGTELDGWQMAALGHACRIGKERLLGEPDCSKVPVVVPSRGAKLVGAAIRAELTRDEVTELVLEGFFPTVASTARPVSRPRTGLTTIGLPYASDPAITRHLAAFLARQRSAAREVDTSAGGSPDGESRLLHPTALLFNGGVLASPVLRERLVAAVNGWLEAEGAPPVRLLGGADYDHAVARGAAYFGRVRSGRGIRIRGGTARAYYVGIESATPAVPGVEPPVRGMCVAPFGMEEGTEAELPPHELAVIVGEPVRFRFFGSSVRREDEAGTMVERMAPPDVDELAPIEVTLPAEGRAEGDFVPVRLRSEVTAVGTLRLEALPLEPRAADERWKLELNVRGGTTE